MARAQTNDTSLQEAFFADANVVPGVTYRYAVAVLDRLEIAGKQSEPYEITVGGRVNDVENRVRPERGFAELEQQDDPLRILVPVRVLPWKAMFKLDSASQTWSYMDVDDLVGQQIGLEAVIGLRPYIAAKLIDGGLGNDPLGSAVRIATTDAGGASPYFAVRAGRSWMEDALASPDRLSGLTALTADLSYFGMGLAIKVES